MCCRQRRTAQGKLFPVKIIFSCSVGNLVLRALEPERWLDAGRHGVYFMPARKPKRKNPRQLIWDVPMVGCGGVEA